MRTEQELKIKTAKNSIVYAIGQIIGSIAVLITLVALARLLGPGHFGLYAIAFAYYTFLAILGNFAMGSNVRKKLPECKTLEEKRTLIGTQYMTVLTLSMIMCLVGILISGYAAINVYHQPQIVIPLIIASLLVPFWSIFNMTLSVLVGIGKVKEATIIDVEYSIVQMIASIALVAIGYGVGGAIAGLAIGIITGTIIGVAYVIKQLGRIELKVDKKVLDGAFSFSTPVVVSYLAMSGVTNFSVLLLGSFASASIVGNYNLAFKIASFVNVIIASNNFVLLPAFSAASSRKFNRKTARSIYNRSLFYTLLFLLPLIAYIISVSAPLINLLFSHLYLYAPGFLALISIGVAVSIIWNYASVFMLGEGKVRQFMMFQAIAALIEIIMLIAFTPTFHALGMIIALFIVSPILIDLLYVYALNRYFNVRTRLFGIVRIAFASAILFVVLYSVSIALHFAEITLIVDAIISIVIYPPIVAKMGGLRSKDIPFMQNLIGESKAALPISYLLKYAKMHAK